ncbi:MAG: hypothetical protein AAGA66_05150 [Bacteroidota bacterium]
MVFHKSWQFKGDYRAVRIDRDRNSTDPFRLSWTATCISLSPNTILQRRRFKSDPWETILNRKGKGHYYNSEEIGDNKAFRTIYEYRIIRYDRKNRFAGYVWSKNDNFVPIWNHVNFHEKNLDPFFGDNVSHFSPATKSMWKTAVFGKDSDHGNIKTHGLVARPTNTNKRAHYHNKFKGMISSVRLSSHGTPNGGWDDYFQFEKDPLYDTFVKNNHLLGKIICWGGILADVLSGGFLGVPFVGALATCAGIQLAPTP